MLLNSTSQLQFAYPFVHQRFALSLSTLRFRGSCCLEIITIAASAVDNQRKLLFVSFSLLFLCLLLFLKYVSTSSAKSRLRVLQLFLVLFRGKKQDAGSVDPPILITRTGGLKRVNNFSDKEFFTLTLK